MKQLATFPTSSDGFSALDYGGLAISPDGTVRVFGGGHAATAVPDMWELAPGATAFVSAYPALSLEQVEAAWGTPQIVDRNWLNVPGYRLQPMTVHAYNGNVWARATSRFLKLSGYAGGYYAGIPIVTSGMGEYNPATKTWTPWNASGIGFNTMVCEDPVSGNILLLANDGLRVMDPRKRADIASDGQRSPYIGYDDCLVYFPPTDKFYAIARRDWITGQPMARVCELVVNRNDWSRTLLPPMNYTRPDTVAINSGIAHYAFDPDSGMIVGGLDAGVVYAFHPAKGWLSQPVDAGSMQFHHWGYDNANNRHIVINTQRQVLALKFDPAAWKPVVPRPPEVIAPIAGFASLEDACNAGVPVTIGAGVLRTGAAITKVGTTIAGAGADKTHIIGGGAVWGKGALIVEVPTTISGVSFENVTVSDGNGAGIRHDSGNLVVNDCAFVACQNGYLGDANVAFTRCVFDSNGAGDGQTHAVYCSVGANVVSATDCHFKGTKIGHHFKSRARQSTLTRCVMDAATESYSCDFPWGGIVAINACHITKGADSDNNNCVINYGSESNPVPFAIHSFGMSDTTLAYTGARRMIGVRFDPRVPVDAVFSNVQFVGIATLQTGARSATFSGCTKDGVPI